MNDPGRQPVPGDARSTQELLKALDQPDFVLLKGTSTASCSRAEGPPAAASEPSAVVDSVAVEGDIRTDRADLSVEYGITLRSHGPTLVPIRLDEQTVSGAWDNDRLLFLKAVGGRWQVELRGPGRTRSASSSRSRSGRRWMAIGSTWRSRKQRRRGSRGRLSTGSLTPRPSGELGEVEPFRRGLSAAAPGRCSRRPARRRGQAGCDAGGSRRPQGPSCRRS